jgi:hypothetical protein
MALRVYTKPTESAALSVGGDFALPLSLSLDGRTGGVIDRELFIRNDQETRWYEDISVTALGASPALVNGALGFTVKFITGTKRPTYEEWCLVGAGNTATFSSNIGNAYDAETGIYLPFWMRMEVPRNEPARVIKDIQIILNAMEHLV